MTFTASLRRAGGVRHLLVLLTLLLAAAAALFRLHHQQGPAPFHVAGGMAPGGTAPHFSSRFVPVRADHQVHAASLIELNDGRIRAFWFSGTREGARDVEIHSAVFDPARRQWEPARAVASRAATERALLRRVKKLGNPVPARAADGTLWLFYVTVSVGGWAGSSITAITSQDDGETWTPARRLITSPFFNISTLVKAPPFLYADGTMGLPAYHEFIGKFGLLVRLDGDGRVLDARRLSSGRSGLQPVVLVRSASDALVLMRNTGRERPRRVIGTTTTDAGGNWSSPGRLPLHNPDAALAGLVLPDGRMLVVLNDIEIGRDALSLALSRDGTNWTRVYQLEDQRAGPGADARSTIAPGIANDVALSEAGHHARAGAAANCEPPTCSAEYSYPSLIQAKDGSLHLVYTWNRTRIRHVQFTTSWLDTHFRNNSQ